MPTPSAVPTLRAPVIASLLFGLLVGLLLTLPSSTAAQDPPGPGADGDAPGADGDASIVRLSAEDMVCPPGTSRQRAESPDGRFSALWCEMRQGDRVARHGPYLELFADGSTYRQGSYHRGLQAGRWVRFSAKGEIEREHRMWPGEASRFLPQPEDICPPGTRRIRTTSFSDRRKMNSKCVREGEDGEEILEGPYITWHEELTPRGRRYVLRRIMTYHDDERHGPHRAFDGPYGREAMVEEETFVDGRPQGESRSYYLDGSLREVRHYEGHRFVGERVGYYPNGKERWRIVYEDGRRASTEGDLSVAGEPCPGETVPTTTPDGLEDRCVRRQLHFEEITGPFLLRDRAGNGVETGLYERGEKVELWQSNGRELPPEVPDDVLVAEAVVKLGGEVYLLPTPPEPLPDPWESADLQHEDPEALRAEIDRINALVRAQLEAEQNPELKIWFRNNRTKKYPGPRTEVVDGKVKIFGLRPGSYYMRVEYDAESSSPMQYPGDLTSSTDFEVKLGQVTQFEVNLVYTLHVVEPWDSAQPIPGWGKPCGEEGELPRQVRFAWQAPPNENPDEIEWEYRVRRHACQPFAKREAVAEGRIYDRSVTVELEPSKRGEAYEFTLVARRGDAVIGQLMSFGEQGGHGWSLRFRTR